MLSQVDKRYKDLGIDSVVSAFIDDMVVVYDWADLVICRAGAMTVSEVAAMGVTAIFIPFPNAFYLTDAGAGLLLAQKDLNPSSLAEYIGEALSKLTLMSKNAQLAARLDATEIVAGYCADEAGL